MDIPCNRIMLRVRDKRFNKARNDNRLKQYTSLFDDGEVLVVMVGNTLVDITNTRPRWCWYIS